MELKSQADIAPSFVQSIVNSLPVNISCWSKNGDLVYCTKNYLEIFEVESPEEYVDNIALLSPLNQPSGENSLALRKKYLAQAFKDGAIDFDWVYKTRSGKIYQSKCRYSRFEQDGEFFVAGQIIQPNIPVDVECENDAILRAKIMLDVTPLCCNFWKKTPDGFENIDCNLEAIKLFSLDDKTEYLERFFELSPKYQPDGKLSAESAGEKIITAFNEGYCKFEWLHKKLNGEEIPAEITLIRASYYDESIVVGYTRDMREIKASEAKARIAEERTQVMLDTFPMVANLWDNKGNLIDCNLEAAKLYGFETKEEYMENFSVVSPEYQPDGIKSIDKVALLVAKAFDSGYERFEWVCLHRDGSEIPVEVILIKVTLNNENAVISYVRDLREHKAMLAEISHAELNLRAAIDVAEKNAKAKSEFLANMSHEIRTPMNGILGLLHIINKTELTEKQREYIGKISYSAKSLLRIINDILDFSKIEAGKLELENIPFTLGELREELESLFAPKAEEKGLDLVFIQSDDEDSHYLGDPTRIKQVVFNLVGNAIKFTETGSVTVRCVSGEIKDNHRNFVLSVEDTGIGLSEEQQNRLFTAFNQADSSVTRKYGGTGLGLAISKNLVEIMGGQMWVESEIGKGSKFIFSLSFEIASENDFTTKEQELTVKNRIVARAGHILLVEDNEINQMIAEELLSAVGYKIEIANNGLEALNLLKSKPYDAVLMDIQMPVMDGLTASTKIREQEKFAELPIIAMSAHAMVGDREISLSHGMNEHITKPIDPEILYSTLDTWLQKGF